MPTFILVMRLVALREIEVIAFLVGLWQTFADEPKMRSVFVFVGENQYMNFWSIQLR